MTTKERVTIFIDAEYVIQSMRTLKAKPHIIHIGINDIRWEKITQWLIDGRMNKEILYYSSELDKYENPETHHRQLEYLDRLRKIMPNLQLRLGKMQKVKMKSDTTWSKIQESNHKIHHTWVQKGIDVKLSTDMITKAVENTYDTAILIAGDSDFEDAVNFVKKMGKRIELVTFERSDSGVMNSFAQNAHFHTKLSYQDGRAASFWQERARYQY
jgi:uncharacterized LabA/DUF88 family protein